jgi:hypothetical protein
MEYDYFDNGMVSGACPASPLDQNQDSSGAWTGACDKYQEKKAEAEAAKKLEPSSTATSSQSPKNLTCKNSRTVLRNTTGPGTNRGLTVLVDTLACGWLSTSSFDGLKVDQSHTYIYIII